MKKIITFITISFLVGILVPSCSTKISLVKKHYSKGYYLAFNKVNHNTDSKKQDNVITNLNPSPVYVVQNTNSQKLELKKSSESSKVDIATSKPIAFASGQKLNAINDKKNNQVSKVVFNQKHTFKINNTQVSVKQNRSSNSDEGRSLFWIIILILVILWALGLISGGFGLGVLVNLLLLIALILLILWLLRIV